MPMCTNSQSSRREYEWEMAPSYARSSRVVTAEPIHDEVGDRPELTNEMFRRPLRKVTEAELAIVRGVQTVRPHEGTLV